MSSEASSSSSAAVAVRDLGDDNPSASPEVDTTYWAAQEEATALLESMAARVRGEEELSEEQMQANDQLQEDEVIALEAIFGGDMVILENKDSLRFIQIFVHYSLPDGIRVFLNLRRSGALVGTGDNENHNGGEVCYACRLQHLPPVVLTCLLPRFTVRRDLTRYFCKAFLNAEFVLVRMLCMESHCKIHVKERNLTQLTCPDTNCRSPLPPSLLKSLLRDDGYAQWESFALKKLLDAMPDLVYCPRVALSLQSFCYTQLCYFFHKKKDENDIYLMERQKLHSMPAEQLLKERRELEELMNIQEALRSSKQCPHCKMAISKIEGCNKMICVNCGGYFCYRCNQAIKGYEHFWGGNCVLFGTHAHYQIRNPQQQRDENPGDHAELLEQRVQLTYPCPNCGSRNEKYPKLELSYSSTTLDLQ
uniref:GCN5-related N-acetyltransferase-like n=1 Tax=Oryza sativa subsp. japonica TaxID=39947 RepID=Q6YUR2_ORYSJ|nr:GCN5-related N-acetyltransferase-like [Oryza sativa Japonica Group]BAD08145.1 GCN5-related N-acetyltransferase-like [Oryza sativa Japonica Group]